jgi:hypothetical protein
MDGWKDHYIAQCQFWFYKMLLENGEGRRTEYLDGTAVA